jgi:pimeloyl-ACP methyl ester carboxylesterase
VGAFVEDLEALRAHLGLDRFALIGHSHGGFLALHYALRHPDRVTHLVALDAQLIGIGRHPSERDAQADTPELAAALDHLDAAGGFGAMFDMTTDAEVTAFMRRAVPVYFKEARHGAALERLFAARDLPLRTMQAVSATDGEFPLGEGLRALRVPTLVVNGRYDLLCPPSGGRTLAETIPGARRVVFEESAHFPWLEEPARFFDVVGAFLAAPVALAP